MVLVVAILGTACIPEFGGTDDTIGYGVLTSSSGQILDFSTQGASVTARPVSVPADGNLREVFWQNDTPYYPDQETCVTWESTAASQGLPLAQPGLAMRVAPTADGQGIRAVTVTENIWMYGAWIFNVHVWDTTRSDDPFTLLQSFDLSSIVGTWENVDGQFVDEMAPPPWHVCATTRGDRFSFKVWTGDDPEPSWDDSSRVFTTTLPPGWDYPGYSGGYAGHVHEGQSLTFSDLHTTPYCLAPDRTGTPYCQDLLAGAHTTTSVPGGTSTTTLASG